MEYKNGGPTGERIMAAQRDWNYGGEGGEEEEVVLGIVFPKRCG
jgi:hypothetical protein